MIRTTFPLRWLSFCFPPVHCWEPSWCLVRRTVVSIIKFSSTIRHEGTLCVRALSAGRCRFSCWDSPAGNAGSAVGRRDEFAIEATGALNFTGSAFFTQLLDHNDPSKGTFKQKFWYNSQFWAGPGSPVSLAAYILPEEIPIARTDRLVHPR
jgi:hypothetical protein